MAWRKVEKLTSGSSHHLLWRSSHPATGNGGRLPPAVAIGCRWLCDVEAWWKARSRRLLHDQSKEHHGLSFHACHACMCAEGGTKYHSSRWIFRASPAGRSISDTESVRFGPYGSVRGQLVWLCPDGSWGAPSGPTQKKNLIFFITYIIHRK
jgi:hypothetical protein